MEVTKSDKEILQLTLRDRRFFSLFYKKYFKKIYSYTLAKNNFNQDIAEDIVSSVFMKALEKIESVKLEDKYDNSILPWLYTIARNMILNNWALQKKQSANVSYDEDIDSGDIAEGVGVKSVGSLSSKPDYDAEIDFEDNRDKLKDALNQLDEIGKDIVIKRIYDELQFNEIAEILQMQEAAVKMRYYRAIEYVTKIIKFG